MRNPGSFFRRPAVSQRGFYPPTAKGLDQILPFRPHCNERGQIFVRLASGWPETFYRLGELGPVLFWSTNGWGRLGRHTTVCGWHSIPDSTIWLHPQSGSCMDVSAMGNLIAAEQPCGSETMLSIQIMHRNGHGHLKCLLSHDSKLEAFYEWIGLHAIPDPLSEPLHPTPARAAILPSNKELRKFWTSSFRSLPGETYAGFEPLARLAVIDRLGKEFATPIPRPSMTCLFENLVKYQCGVDFHLYHPDHTTAFSGILRSTNLCSCCRHLYGDHWECHLPTARDLCAYRTCPDIRHPENDWVEIYHRPSRRLLATIRTGPEPVDRMHWRKILDGLTGHKSEK